MPADWEKRLARWEANGLLDPLLADRIRTFESSSRKDRTSRWMTWVTWGLGAFLLGAGVLLLVSTSWNDLSPVARLAVLVTGVAALHLAAGLAERRWPLAAAVLHFTAAVGLGPAIFTAGDVFGMNGSWARAVLMWLLGAALAWRLRREPAYTVLVALLVPVWLMGEWAAATEGMKVLRVLVIEVGWFLGCLACLAASDADARRSSDRLALDWVGRVLFLPVAMFLGSRAAFRLGPDALRIDRPDLPPLGDPGALLLGVGWTVAVALPLLVAVAIRGRRAWINGAMALWAVTLVTLPIATPKLVLYGWLALGALLFIAWALYESNVVRLNLGVVAFALIVVFFYFDSVMGQFGRSASLIGLGVLFLAGGYALERARRRMVGHVMGGVS